MKPVLLFFESVEVDLKTGPDIRDITPQLQRLIKAADVEDGVLCAAVVGSTGSLTTIEFEPGVVEDLKRAVNRLAPPGVEYEQGVVEDLRRAIIRLAPPGMDYEHEKAWHDGNGHSHVQAALLGPSIALPIRDRELKLGTWQQVVTINHDNRARTGFCEHYGETEKAEQQ